MDRVNNLLYGIDKIHKQPLFAKGRPQFRNPNRWAVSEALKIDITPVARSDCKMKVIAPQELVVWTK